MTRNQPTATLRPLLQRIGGLARLAEVVDRCCRRARADRQLQSSFVGCDPVAYSARVMARLSVLLSQGAAQFGDVADARQFDDAQLVAMSGHLRAALAAAKVAAADAEIVTQLAEREGAALFA